MTLAELAADAANPRAIDDDAAEGLANSLEAFGDLAGIVWNKRTGNLIAGHQRVKALAGDAEPAWQLIDGARELGALVIDGRRFPVRVVDWSIEKQRAANLAANNPKIQGKFTDELESYLLTVKHELEPELWDDVGLSLLVGVAAAELAPAESWQVVVDCESEEQQKRLYDELLGRGIECRLVTM